MVGKNKGVAKSPAELIRSSAADCLTFLAYSGEGDVEAVCADETIWLAKKIDSALCNVNVQTIKYHLRKIFDENGSQEDPVIRKYGTTAGHRGKVYLNSFIKSTDLAVLQYAGCATPEIGKVYVKSKAGQSKVAQDRLFDSGFDRLLKQSDGTLFSRCDGAAA